LFYVIIYLKDIFLKPLKTIL